MAGLYSHTTRSSGTTLTANIYNTDHQNHINNHELDQINDHSDNSTEMQTQTDPYPGESISQATSAAAEIERLRFQLDLIIGRTFWYEDPAASLANVGTNTTNITTLTTRLDGSEFITQIRMFT